MHGQAIIVRVAAAAILLAAPASALAQDASSGDTVVIAEVSLFGGAYRGTVHRRCDFAVGCLIAFDRMLFLSLGQDAGGRRRVTLIPGDFDLETVVGRASISLPDSRATLHLDLLHPRPGDPAAGGEKVGELRLKLTDE